MPSVNARLADTSVDHAIDLRRYTNGVLRRIIAVLNRADASLMAALSEALMQVEPSQFTVERLEALLLSVRAVNGRAYAAVEAELAPELRALAGVEAAHQAGALRRTVPAAVQLAFPLAGISAEQAYAAAMARPFQGRLLRDWARNLEADRLAKIRNAVRAGYVEGRTASEIVRTIKGSAALKYADGLLDKPRRDLMTVVQTAISHTAQVARAEFYRANADLVKAVQWVATLDNRTTPECAARDGHTYSADAHEPLDGGPPWLGGPGALHFNCRSVDVPILKSWRELGLPADEAPAGTRASMDGQVPAEMTYPEWFARQPAERQDEIVGPTRGALYRAGEVSFDKFTDDKGRWLTLDELKRRGG